MALKTPNLPGIEVRVVQKPIFVNMECPDCEYEASWPYDEFKSMYGDPPDWTGEKITCPNCGKEYRINSQDWD